MREALTPQLVSKFLKSAGFDRAQMLSRAQLHHRYTAGFYVEGDSARVFVRWRPQTSLVHLSSAQLERNRATALEMAARHAEAIASAGWAAEVIHHLAGPVVVVTLVACNRCGAAPAPNQARSLCEDCSPDTPLCDACYLAHAREVLAEAKDDPPGASREKLQLAASVVARAGGKG